MNMLRNFAARAVRQSAFFTLAKVQVAQPAKVGHGKGQHGLRRDGVFVMVRHAGGNHQTLFLVHLHDGFALFDSVLCIVCVFVCVRAIGSG